jgi:hypothetical protein
MKGSERSYFDVALRLGSFFKHLVKKICNSGDLLLTVYGGLVAIITMATTGFILTYLGSPSHSSTSMMPSDQISTLSVYYYFLMSYGAIQAGVPASSREL